jgi:hypothetical protein
MILSVASKTILKYKLKISLSIQRALSVEQQRKNILEEEARMKLFIKLHQIIQLRLSKS